MTLQQLKYMIIIAERGSITEAAKELYSKRIIPLRFASKSN